MHVPKKSTVSQRLDKRREAIRSLGFNEGKKLSKGKRVAIRQKILELRKAKEHSALAAQKSGRSSIREYERGLLREEESKAHLRDGRQDATVHESYRWAQRQRELLVVSDYLLVVRAKDLASNLSSAHSELYHKLMSSGFLSKERKVALIIDAEKKLYS